MSLRSLLVMLSCVIISEAGVFANSGKTGFSFLKIGVGGQAGGMGEAAVTTVTDATASYWNPAGLAWNDKNNISFTYNRWIEDVSHNSICGKLKWDENFFGLYYVYTGVDDIEQREAPTEDPSAYFSSHDLLLGASWARKFGERWAAGITSKYIYERIQNSVQAAAFDVGVWHKVKFVYDNPSLDDRWRVGMAVSNIGISGKMINQTVRLPLTIRAGTSYDVIKSESSQYTLALDLIHVRGENVKGAVGMDYFYREFFHVRAGYQIGFASRNFTAGIGLKATKNIRIDYGFMPMSHDLGSTHRFTASFDF